jgi:hypothetical protein
MYARLGSMEKSFQGIACNKEVETPHIGGDNVDHEGAIHQYPIGNPAKGMFIRARVQGKVIKIVSTLGNDRNPDKRTMGM